MAKANIKQLAQELKKYGRRGDTDVVHVNSQEKAVLKALGGAGTPNPVTGLPEYAPQGGQAGGKDGTGKGSGGNKGGGGDSGGRDGGTRDAAGADRGQSGPSKGGDRDGGTRDAAGADRGQPGSPSAQRGDLGGGQNPSDRPGGLTTGDPEMDAAIKEAYSSPTRQVDTMENERAWREADADSQDDGLGGLFNALSPIKEMSPYDDPSYTPGQTTANYGINPGSVLGGLAGGVAGPLGSQLGGILGGAAYSELGGTNIGVGPGFGNEVPEGPSMGDLRDLNNQHNANMPGGQTGTSGNSGTKGNPTGNGGAGGGGGLSVITDEDKKPLPTPVVPSAPAPTPIIDINNIGKRFYRTRGLQLGGLQAV